MNEDERYAVLRDRITALETHKAVDAVHRGNVESRLGSIESTLTWLVRLVIGGMVLAIVGFMIDGGFVGG